MNKDEPTHLLKLLYPRKWWENCNQCITISNRFCQVKQIKWVQPFFFFFCLYVSIKYKWWKKLDKNSLWKENLPPSSRSILMTSPDMSVWKKKRTKYRTMRKKNSLVRWTTWKQSWLRFPTELARGQKSLELRFNLKQCDLVTVHKNWPGYFVNWQSSLRIIYSIQSKAPNWV